jgi:3D-(3,5/4)-trihydroxycyclohexane-1,2-dione acylhydrolase (decyclizing)
MPIDYAKSAEGYGVKTYKVTTMDELREALKDSLKQKESTLIDIKVLPKTMTEGYKSWWHVGIASTSEKESVRTAFENKEANLLKARLY